MRKIPSLLFTLLIRQHTSRFKQFRLAVCGAFAAVLIVIGNPGTAVAAQQLTGDVGFTGAFKAANDSFASVSLGVATSIDYNGNGIADTGIGMVPVATGDFSYLLHSGATLYDFTFNPLTAGGVNPLWSLGQFTFVLESVSIITQDANALILAGTGTVRSIDFADTGGAWNFTGHPDGSFFNFSSNTAAVTAIPEPEIYAMLAAGLGLMGFVARWRKRSAA